MVLESLYPADWIKKRWWFLLLLGIAYSTFSIAIALVFFPDNPSLVAVGFISILFLSSIGKLISREEVSTENRLNKAVKKRFVEKLFFLFNSYKHLIKIYFLIYAAVFLVFAFFSLTLPIGATTHFFEEQSLLANSLMFSDVFSPNSFNQIINNNLKVLATAFLASVLFGTGAIFIFFIAWNASVTGTVFGLITKNQAGITNIPPYLLFVLILIVLLPHIILEMLSYFSIGIGGGLLSRIIVKHKLQLKKLANLSTYLLMTLFLAIILLILAGLIESYITPLLINVFISLLT